ncbi:MAG: SHOCT domain-containing protein [Chloroflexi bacterium]|nr:SHOCT domain-containing protein [Chloroflexota bacterium]
MMGPGMMGGFGWGFGPIIMIVFWGLVIWGIAALVRGVNGSGGCDGHSGGGGSDAIEVLKRRYARGEIKKEEFEQMKKDLI